MRSFQTTAAAVIIVAAAVLGACRSLGSYPNVHFTPNLQVRSAVTTETARFRIGDAPPGWDGGAGESLVLTSPVITEADVISAERMTPGASGGSNTVVIINLTPAAGKRFEALTARSIAKKLPITFDGKVVEAPTVASVITGGNLQITGGPGQMRTLDSVLEYLSGRSP